MNSYLQMSSCKRITAISFIALIVIGLLTGCEEQRTSGEGLYLPPGNIEDGKGTFVNLGCVQCHSIVNTDFPDMTADFPVMLELGGNVGRVKTYGELITAITNPDHIISPEYLIKIKSNEVLGKRNSPMPSFIDEMTVSQLIDLVTFLDSHYKKIVPRYIGHGIQYVQH